MWAQDGKAEAQVQIDALDSAKRRLERKLAALAAKSTALKEANAAQAVTLEGLQVQLTSALQSFSERIWHLQSACHDHRTRIFHLEGVHRPPPPKPARRCRARSPEGWQKDALHQRSE